MSATVRRNTAEEPAAPLYGLGTVVRYRDHHGRWQSGEVEAIEASWRYGAGRPPLIVYQIAHPSYRNRRCYATGEDIGCAVGRVPPVPVASPRALEASHTGRVEP